MTSVRLIAISKPAIEDVPSTPDLLAFCARVSSTANQDKHATGGKLLRSLVKRKEWSPFEMVSLTMEITTTRDIGRQILRHRSFSFQEFSQRYAVVEETPVFRQARLQHQTDRQMSVDAADVDLRTWWADAQHLLAGKAHATYQAALTKGIAKEVARAVLPEGLTLSRIYMAGTLRSWLHYVWLRSTEATQKEHRDVALGCTGVIRSQFPDLADLISPETV